MLTNNEFKILFEFFKKNDEASDDAGTEDAKPVSLSQRELSKSTGLSLGTVNSTLADLRGKSMIDDEGKVTRTGIEALEPYRVTNAVIMAAGLSSRFAPISYETPKGLLTVRGEILVERQIRQLKEAGIDQIYLVLGYKKEQFFYLEDEFGVKIRINEEYAKRNNNSTIRRVEDILDNTYICSSDDYFTSNPFEPYVYRSYYSGVFVEGETEEYTFDVTGKDNKIRSVNIGGRDSWILLGHAYWDRRFSSKFVQILEDEYDEPATAQKLWEDIYMEHIDELPMVMRPYEDGVIWEFDSLDEVSAFDPSFIQNIDSTILENICDVLDCTRSQICAVMPVKQGLTNLSFKFEVDGSTYIYRHPGEGTDEIINRESEAFSQSIAKKLDLDDTFIHEDPKEGWKISRYIEGCHTLDYHDWDEVEKALVMARTLHTADVESAWSFDIFDEIRKVIHLLGEREKMSFRDFKELQELAETLHDMVVDDGVPKCLCHNDFYDPNFLIKGDEMSLIDWEYSGMSDYASDLGTFICCSDYSFDEAYKVLTLYFGRRPTAEEERHCIAYVGLCSFYWFVWALYKEACGDVVGEWLYLWYKNAKAFGNKALELSAGI